MSVSIVSKGHSAGRQAEPAWRRPFVWLNLVCLDAPLVAVAWQWLIASSLHLAVALADSAALFLTAWGIYLADRLADYSTQTQQLRQKGYVDDGRTIQDEIADIEAGRDPGFDPTEDQEEG
jgi:hypothetical protein